LPNRNIKRKKQNKKQTKQNKTKQNKKTKKKNKNEKTKNKKKQKIKMMTGTPEAAQLKESEKVFDVR
jgi:hypothetical protein